METDQDKPADVAADGDAVERAEFVDSEEQTPHERLRSAREAQRLELSQIAAETRIPIRHLEKIDTGDFAALPSRTYAIGFARSYARAVGLDEKSIADAVREELAGIAAHSAIKEGMEPGDPAKLPSRGLAWFGAFAALILAIGVIAMVSSYYRAGSPLPSLLASAEQNAGPASETDVGAQAGSGTTDGSAQSSAPSPDGEVEFTALEDGVWVRFYEDGGERLFEAQMSSGESFTIPADAVEPRINTGRPDAFAITIGGRRVAKLAEQPVTMGDTPVSAAALLSRNDPPSGQ